MNKIQAQSFQKLEDILQDETASATMAFIADGQALYKPYYIFTPRLHCIAGSHAGRVDIIWLDSNDIIRRTEIVVATKKLILLEFSVDYRADIWVVCSGTHMHAPCMMMRYKSWREMCVCCFKIIIGLLRNLCGYKLYAT